MSITGCQEDRNSVVKPFVKQLGIDNHFGCSKDPHKVIKLLRMDEEIDELDDGSLICRR